MNKGKAILFASTNMGKIIEVRKIASQFGIEILSPSDLADELGIGIPQIDEDGVNYLENAKKKAEGFFEWAGVACVADDTGLEVDALSGMPGVGTARYAGPNATPVENMNKLLGELENCKDRSARFVCRLYLLDQKGGINSVESSLEGEISVSPRGGGGFGYDPIFIVKGYGKTLAELKEAGQPIETHRIKALKALFQGISELS